MNPYLIAGALFAVIASYFYGRHDGSEIQAAAQLREERIATIVREEAMKGAAEQIAKITVVNKTIQGKLETVIREKTVYNDPRCVADPIGMSLINAAITNASKSAGDKQLPGTGSAGRPELRGGGQEAGGGERSVSPMSGSGSD